MKDKRRWYITCVYLCSTERWFMVKVLLCSNLQEGQTFYRRGLGIKNLLHTRLMYNVQCTRTVQAFISFPSNKILPYWLHIFLFLWKVGKEFFSFCLKSKFWELFELSIKKKLLRGIPPSFFTYFIEKKKKEKMIDSFI